MEIVLGVAEEVPPRNRKCGPISSTSYPGKKRSSTISTATPLLPRRRQSRRSRRRAARGWDVAVLSECAVSAL